MSHSSVCPQADLVPALKDLKRVVKRSPAAGTDWDAQGSFIFFDPDRCGICVAYPD